jgi:hypothetical protein
MKIVHKISNSKTEDWLKRRVDSGYLTEIEDNEIIHKDQLLTKKKFYRRY